MSIATEPTYPPEGETLPEPPPPPATNFHWSMRLISLLSLAVLGVYTYVLLLCRHEKRHRPANLREGQRLRLSLLAFGLDLSISAYFSAVTPLILKNGGLPFDRKHLPRPLFWFFAVTGFVPTASMLLTVLGGWRWRQRIRYNKGWRSFHGRVGWLAYFSWWLAVAPVLLMGLLGEQRTIDYLKKSGWLDK